MHACLSVRVIGLSINCPVVGDGVGPRIEGIINSSSPDISIFMSSIPIHAFLRTAPLRGG